MRLRFWFMLDAHELVRSLVKHHLGWRGYSIPLISGSHRQIIKLFISGTKTIAAPIPDSRATQYRSDNRCRIFSKHSTGRHTYAVRCSRGTGLRLVPMPVPRAECFITALMVQIPFETFRRSHKLAAQLRQSDRQ